MHASDLIRPVSDHSQLDILAQNCVNSCEALVCPIHNFNYI